MSRIRTAGGLAHPGVRSPGSWARWRRSSALWCRARPARFAGGGCDRAGGGSDQAGGGCDRAESPVQAAAASASAVSRPKTVARSSAIRDVEDVGPLAHRREHRFNVAQLEFAPLVLVPQRDDLFSCQFHRYSVSIGSHPRERAHGTLAGVQRRHYGTSAPARRGPDTAANASASTGYCQVVSHEQRRGDWVTSRTSPLSWPLVGRADELERSGARGDGACGVVVRARAVAIRRTAGRCAPGCRRSHARHSRACPTAAWLAPARSRRPRRAASRTWRRARRCGSGRRSWRP